MGSGNCILMFLMHSLLLKALMSVRRREQLWLPVVTTCPSAQRLANLSSKRICG